jgi:hypothetical protein
MLVRRPANSHRRIIESLHPSQTGGFHRWMVMGGIDIPTRYSGSDIAIVVRDSLMQPVRKVLSATHFKKVSSSEDSNVLKWTPCSPGDPDAVEKNWSGVESDDLQEPPLRFADFLKSLESVRPTVTSDDIVRHEEWTKESGAQRRGPMVLSSTEPTCRCRWCMTGNLPLPRFWLCSSRHHSLVDLSRRYLFVYFFHMFDCGLLTCIDAASTLRPVYEHSSPIIQACRRCDSYRDASFSHTVEFCQIVQKWQVRSSSS